jgi:hypothetical protein
MALERDFDLLDDYLANRLQGEKKEAFEKQLESDPELKREQQLQQKLIEGIKNARIAELKAMMNNTVVPPIQGGQAAWLTKVAAWLVVAGAMSAGIYFYFHQDDKEKENTAEEPVTNKAIEQPKEIAQNMQPAVEENKATVENKSESIANETPTVKKDEKTKRKNVAKPNPTAAQPQETEVADRQKPDAFDPTGEIETSSSAPENDAVRPKNNEAKIVASSIEVTTDNTNKKYSFHYQFKNGKLFLYGSFEQNLYEIMEFFSGSKRTLFLFYKDNYYLLNEDNEKIKSLEAINDPVLQDKLKEYRANN